VASVVSEAFRAGLLTALSDDEASFLHAARGSAPERREINRALMLNDRAIREWAAMAVAHERPGAPNVFEELGPIAKPEDGYHHVEPAARTEQGAAMSSTSRAVADAVREVGEALAEIDTEADVAGNRVALDASGRAAARVLVQASAVLGAWEFVVEQGNRVLADLVGLTGWANQLGPRFE
jgi:hypothetical protein